MPVLLSCNTPGKIFLSQIFHHWTLKQPKTQPARCTAAIPAWWPQPWSLAACCISPRATDSRTAVTTEEALQSALYWNWSWNSLVPQSGPEALRWRLICRHAHKVSQRLNWQVGSHRELTRSSITCYSCVA